MKKSYKQYVKQVQTNFTKLKNSGRSKDYWNLIKRGNSSNGSHDGQCNINEFYDFFKQLNACDNPDDQNSVRNTDINEDLDKPISEEQILSCIARLKNNKARGIDDKTNEYIKATQNCMLPVYHKLFNLVFESGTVPMSWTIGVIKPIYKKKGDPQNPDNYRPITIVSCLGKLFTSILNNRLNDYVEENSILGEEQLGFRQSYSTIDGIFIIQSLIELVSAQNKNIYAAFIDLKKAFMSISRPLLFKKLSDINVGSRMLEVIRNMYGSIKSCVFTHNQFSPLFPCLVGLREGENLSPILYSLYMNVLYEYLSEKTKHGLTVDTEFNNVTLYLRIFLIMYADDTVLLAESKAGLQELLKNYDAYCKENKLNINSDKTKIITFGKCCRKPKLYLNDIEIEVVNQFKYLGLIINRRGRYMNAIKDNINKSRKAFFLLMKNARQNHIPLNCQIDLFVKTIEPILLYGAEVWGFEKCDVIENLG